MRQLSEEQNLLSRTECNLIRGFAIIAIVINNFTHLINGVVQDNEFVFDYSQVEAFSKSLMNPSLKFVFDLIAFYSPFGVMLFIFLSGYGLTIKYEKDNQVNVSYKEFLYGHYTKLFLMQLKGLALFLLIVVVFNHDYIVYFRHLLGQILMVENLNPVDPIILAGPYWFFGMIMEVYVIYRFLIYKRPSSFIYIIICLSLLIMAVAEPNGEIIRYMRINFLMAILPFSMGVIVVRNERFLWNFVCNQKKCLFFILLNFVLLTTCKINFYTWLFMPVFIIGISIPLAKVFSRTKVLSRVLVWVGALSGVIFVIHPIVREILIQRTNLSGNYYGMCMVYLFLTIVLSMVLKPLFYNNK